MSTENLSKNQKFIYDIIRFYENNGNSAGYLASLETAKTSNAASLPEIETNKPSDGSVHVHIHAAAGHYTLEIVVTKPLRLPPVTGNGTGSTDLVGDWDFHTDFILLNGATLDDLLERKKTTLTWYSAGPQTVAIVSGLDGQNLLHLMNCPVEMPSGSSLPVDWSVQPVP